MRKRILIVDDNLALSRVTQFALEHAGYDTQISCDGEEALAHARRRQFDLIITDQQMPKLSGLELCSALRKLPEYVDCPIVMLTAKGLELELKRLREELGISAAFPKPFSPSAVVKVVNELIGKQAHLESCPPS